MPAKSSPVLPQTSPLVQRPWVFAIVVLPLLMSAIDSTIVATALHALQTGLGTSIEWAGWTITAYVFGTVLMFPVSGKLSERYGRRRVFLASTTCFTLASLGCGLVTNIYALIALRAVQAAGGAGFTPSATGIIVDYFGDARDRAVGLFGSIFPMGAMIGPIFGGLLVTYGSWRDIFFVNGPIGVVVLILALRYIPSDPRRATPAPRDLDATGIALLGIGLLSGMLVATVLSGTAATASWPRLLALLGVAVCAIWGFFRHIRQAKHPFIAPRFIYGPSFGAVNLVNLLLGGMPIGIVTLLPLYATTRYGIGVLGSGTLLIAQGIATVALATGITGFLRRTGYRWPLYAGDSAIVLGMVLLACPPVGGLSPYAWLSVSSLILGAGVGAINPPSRNAGLQLAPEHAATLAALRSMGMQLGSLVTVAVATALLTNAHHPAEVQAWFNVVTACVLLLALPVITRVPEHHGAW